jgi:hypothetical protein
MREWKYSSTILTSALDRGKQSASCPCRFTQKIQPPAYILCRRLIAFRAGLDSVERRKRPSLRQKSNPALSVFHPIAYSVYRYFCNVFIMLDVDAGRGDVK